MLPDLAQLQQSLQEAENRCMRVMADFDNFRKRTLANQAEANREEKKRLILDLLEVVDNFQRAMEHAGGEDFVSGMQAIQQQFLSILGRHGLERLEAQDRPFDPNFHEVLDTVARPRPARADHHPGVQGRVSLWREAAAARPGAGRRPPRADVNGGEPELTTDGHGCTRIRVDPLLSRRKNFCRFTDSPIHRFTP